MTIASLMKEERPLAFFGSVGALLAILSITLAVPIVGEFLKTGLVPRVPTAVLITGLMIVAFLSFTCGLILQTVTRGRLELKRLHYLAISIRMDRPK